MERTRGIGGSEQSWGSGAVRRFLGSLASRIQTFGKASGRKGGRSGSWWGDDDLEGASSFSRAVSGWHVAPTRQAEFWEENNDAPDPGQTPEPLTLLEGKAEPGAVDPEPVECTEAPRAAMPRRSYAERTSTDAPVRMARYLELSGVLQSADRDARFFELPRARFRPRLAFRVNRPISMDLIRDGRSPPQKAAGGERLSFFGKIAL